MYIFKQIITTLLLFAAIQAKATFRENLLFSVHLDGAQMVPSATTDSRGLGTVMLNKKRDSLSIHLNSVGFVPTTAGIYIGGEGSNGILVFDLSDAIFGNTIQKRLNGTMVKTNLAKLMTDNFYIVIGSADSPSGVIRGQIKLVTDWHYVADFKGSEVVPGVSTSAYGLGSFCLTLDKKRVDFKILCKNLSGPITGLDLSKGLPGTNGSVSLDLTNTVVGNLAVGSFVPTPDQITDLLKGELYFQVRTAANPNGEIRSQLRHQRGFTMETFSDGQQMVPAVSTQGRALGVYRLSPTMDSLFYDIVVDNIATSLDYIHLHVGYAGQAYAALQIDFTSSISGNRIRGVAKGLSANSLTRIITSNLTLLTHTGAHPNGEIRGHLNRFVHEGLTLQLDNTPTVSTDGYGLGYAAINNDQDRVYYAWLAGNLTSTPTAVSFVHVPPGQSGIVVRDLMSNTQVNGSSASGAGTWTSADTPPFLLVNAFQFDEKKIHFQLSTTNNSTGELTGIVRPGMVFYNSTSAVQSPDLSTAQLSLSPNPATNTIEVQSDQIFAEKVIIKVMDIHGKVMIAEQVVANGGRLNAQFDLNNFSNGVYLCMITDGKKLVTRKFIKG